CWALDLPMPTTIEARTAGNTHSDMAPHGAIIYYEFAGHGTQPPVKLTWYDGGLEPATPLGWPEDEQLPTRGVLFVGDKGMLFCGGAGGKPRLIPEAKNDAYKQPAPKIPRVKSHHADWLGACKGGTPAGSNFQYGARLTEITLLGVLAIRTGKKITWDAANMKVANMPEADAIIH